VGTPERARRKAALAISELGVTDMATILGDTKVSPRDRINAFEQLKDVAMLGGKQVAAAAAAGGVGPVFGGALIQIVLPNGTHMQVGQVDPEPALPVIEGELGEVE
jgi:hypothetical protein